MSFPTLPARAAYLKLGNGARRNALSVQVLKDLRQQLKEYNTPPGEETALLLPNFQLHSMRGIGRGQKGNPRFEKDYAWLTDSEEWQKRRGDLPKVLVLRSEGPVFCAGHDLKELHELTPPEVEETFDLCAEVMRLIRRSPIPVVGVIHGLATAAGAQLALTTDLPIAIASAQFQLPGMSIGLPCTSPSAALSRKLGNAFTYRMLALAEPVRADELPAGAVETVSDADVLETRVSEVVDKLANQFSAQAQAMGKWAFYAQIFTERSDRPFSDPLSTAEQWGAGVMASGANTDDAIEGRRAFIEKRAPTWRT